MAGADGQAGEEGRFVVVVVAGAVDGELPVVGGADVAQAAQFERGGVGQRRVDVAEGPAVADLQAGDLRPAFAGPGAQPDLPRDFRTAYLWLIHAADCRSRYSSWTCCGVRY